MLTVERKVAKVEYEKLRAWTNTAWA